MDQEVCLDSVLLENLTEDSFIGNLHQRYKRDNIYVIHIILFVIFSIQLNIRVPHKNI